MVRKIQSNLDIRSRPAIGGLSRRSGRDSLSGRSGSSRAPSRRPAKNFLRDWAWPIHPPAKCLVAAGKTSIRAGFGMFYTAIEALTVSVAAANAPYGTTYTSPAPPLFNDPFVTASNGQNAGQPFPVSLAPLNVTSSRPDANINWSQYLPISGIPAYLASNKIPYTEQYMFSIQRQLGERTLVSANYVGNEGHRLLVLVESNPGNPALCLSLSQPGAVAAGTVTCGPFGEGNSLHNRGRSRGQRNAFAAGRELRQ